MADVDADQRAAIKRERDRQLAPWAVDPSRPVPVEHLPGCFHGLLQHAERDEANREGLLDTPDRAARAWRELTSGYGVDPAELLTTFHADGYDEMVLLRQYAFHSLCEHHLLPFTGVAHVGYIPDRRIVGLSKLGRVVDAYARRLQVQERLTSQVARLLDRELKPKGVIVVLEARHMCMELRGVHQTGQTMVTSAVRGVLKDKPEARAEALALIGGT